MQLDIFNDSRDVMLRNDAVQALQRRDAPGARAAWRALAAHAPDDEALAPMTVLLGVMEQPVPTGFTSHAALSEARHDLEQRIAPAARRLLGEREAGAWLLPLWRQAAGLAASLPFSSERPDDHAACLWLRAEDWRAAMDAAGGIESWRRIPAPLGWMLEARFHIEGLDAVWPLLAELAWLAPTRLVELAHRLDDPPLAKLLRAFGISFEERGDASDLAWFPAWVLTEKPGLSRLLSEAQPGRHTEPEQAMRLLVELIGLERQGRQHDLVHRRKRLRDLHQGLSAAYMKTR